MAKTKALISFAVTAKLICTFVFAYAEYWFSLDAAHISSSIAVDMCDQMSENRELLKSSSSLHYE